MNRTSTPALRNDRLLAAATLPLYVCAVGRYGYQALVLAAVSAAIGYAAERLGEVIRKRERKPLGIVTWLLFPLIFPPGFPLGLAAVSIFLGILFGSVFFGGHGRAIASPLALGWAFASLSFPTAFGFGWVKPFPGFLGFTRFTAGVPIIDHPIDYYLTTGRAGLADLAFGAFPQPLGNAVPLVLVCLGVLLLALRALDAPTAVSFFGVMTGLTLLFHALLPERVPAAASLLVGDFLFAGFFALADERTAARTRQGRWLTGLLSGITAFLIRHFAGSPDGAYFAVLVGNSFCALLDELVMRRALPGGKR